MADERIAFTVHADMSGFQRSAAWMIAALNGTGEPRTRTHAINPETGEFTPLDFHRQWLHVMDTQHPHAPQESDMDDRKNTTDQCQADPRTHSEKALDLIADRLRDVVLELRVGPIPDTLTEIRDRLPERVEAKVAPFDPDVLAANVESIKHEVETPMRGHGECCEPVDITEEPPVGSQVTDREGDVWERREGGWALWWPDRSGWVADLYGGELDPWPFARNHAPLRPTTDEDRKRVGLPAEGCPTCTGSTRETVGMVCQTCGTDYAPDVDPDEALAKVIHRADDSDPHNWPYVKEARRGEYRSMARAAREHIEAEVLRKVERATDDRYDRVLDRANKAEAKAVDYEGRYERSHATNMAAQSALVRAEADLARVTKERDRLTHLLGSHADGHRCTCEMTDPGKPGIEPPTWEQDPWCLTHPDMDVIVAEVKTLKAKADRYDALRR